MQHNLEKLKQSGLVPEDVKASFYAMMLSSIRRIQSILGSKESRGVKLAITATIIKDGEIEGYTKPIVIDLEPNKNADVLLNIFNALSGG